MKSKKGKKIKFKVSKQSVRKAKKVGGTITAVGLSN